MKNRKLKKTPKLILIAFLAIFTLFVGNSAASALKEKIEKPTLANIELQKTIKEISDNRINYCLSKEDVLLSNEQVLHYMYSNDEGYYFLDAFTSDGENVIFVPNVTLLEAGINTTELHHGQRFVGVFYDESLWELETLYPIEKPYAE